MRRRGEAGHAGPRDDQVGAVVLDEREGRLVLDVLELDAVRAPDEHREGVRRVDDVGDLEAAPLGFLEVLVGRVDAQRRCG